MNCFFLGSHYHLNSISFTCLGKERLYQKVRADLLVGRDSKYQCAEINMLITMLCKMSCPFLFETAAIAFLNK